MRLFRCVGNAYTNTDLATVGARSPQLSHAIGIFVVIIMTKSSISERNRSFCAVGERPGGLMTSGLLAP